MKERITEGREVRCERKPAGCEGRFGKLLGIYLNPGPGWYYEGGEPTTVALGEQALVGGTWRPTKRARAEWHKARVAVSRGSASEMLKQQVREGLGAFARPEPTPGWNPEDEELLVADGRRNGEAAAVPLDIACYVCGLVNEVPPPI